MSELSDERLAEIIEEMSHGLFEATFDEALLMARELQRRRASALPAVGDVERMREATIEECAKVVEQFPSAHRPVIKDGETGEFIHSYVKVAAKLVAMDIRALSAAPSGDGREGACDHEYTALDDKGWECKKCGHQT